MTTRRIGVALILVAACGGDDVRYVVTDGGLVNTIDARVVLDAHVLADAASGTSGDAVVGDCHGDLVTLPASRAEGRVFSTAIANNQIFVATLTPSCGGSATQATTHGITLTRMLTNEVPDASVPYVSAGATDCDDVRLPTLTAQRRAVNLFYASNQAMTGPAEIFTENLLAPSAPVQLTTGSTGTLEEIAVRVDNALAIEMVSVRRGWFTAVRSGMPLRELNTMPLSDHVAQLAVTTIGTAASDGTGALAWFSDSETKPGIFLSFYDAQASLTEPLAITTDVGAESRVGLATQATRAAVVYTDAAGTLLFRTIERDKTMGDVVHLTSGGQEVSDVSIASYSIGYLIAYRSLALQGGQSVVRVLAVDELGHQSGTRFISETRRDGNGVDVRVANDGRIVVTWSEPNFITNELGVSREVGVNVNVARLSCL